MDAKVNSEVPACVAFTVPYLTPPSVNHYKKPTRRRNRLGNLVLGFRLTKTAIAFKDAVAIFARGATVAPVSDRDRAKVKYGIHAKVYLGKRQRLDNDNAGKVLYDALQYAGVIHSDAFVADGRIEIFKDDRENPRTEITARRLN
jgi:Holliday junction resolvase RusA-like endonuclease